MYAKTMEHDKKAARKLAKALTAKGWLVSVFDGEAWVLKRSTDAAAIFDAMGETDQDELIVRDANGERIGWIWCIYGNGPGELCADYTAEGPVAELIEELFS